GVSDAVGDGETGFLIKAGDIIDFKEKLIKMIDDDNLRSTLGEHSKEKAKKDFTIGKMIDSYEKVFMEVMN
ncbi:hypothetical protein K0B04_02000, partial [Patescibacteria group bacterium]|nr:hypothetical protein [Patescibacteria group bacterium]